MADTPLHVVFDTRLQGYQGWGAALIPIAIAVVVALMLHLLDKGRRPPWVRMAIVVALGAALSAGALISSWRHFADARGALAAGRCEKIEGRITRFRPADGGHHRPEVLEIGSRQISYRRNEGGTAAFTGVRDDGRPVRAGQYVRICLYEGRILRLETTD